MKQVQQSDEDRSMFIVTYQGKHTCMQAADLVAMQQDKKQLKEPQETIISIETPDLVRNQEVPGSPSFSFPPIIPGIVDVSGNNNFSLMTLDNHSTSSPFSGPTASESSSFSIYNILNNSEGRHNLPTSEYDDLCELTSATSVLDPTEVYLDLDSYV
ncbi:hypothetical protein MKX03_021580 [Papaver bracteatum]|nr:hypothetical protein MKX03_021578 [Papaver bracteatum]KAI3870106.1 hypothetical protein MKX03_021579 [Papaver bracteatum]KAI3870107.1 hypothetical protein MKX03_021580 [Papaver bracteatum]